jgi:hypothetical protein
MRQACQFLASHFPDVAAAAEIEPEVVGLAIGVSHGNTDLPSRRKYLLRPHVLRHPGQVHSYRKLCCRRNALGISRFKSIAAVFSQTGNSALGMLGLNSD